MVKALWQLAMQCTCLTTAFRRPVDWMVLGSMGMVVGSNLPWKVNGLRRNPAFLPDLIICET